MSNYGWSSDFPESRLTVSATAGTQHVPNERIRHNLSLLSDFLGKIPFPVKVTSGYRTAGTTIRIGGSATSQHPNGLAVDMIPMVPGMNNFMLGTWLYAFQKAFPEIDQVITYTDKNHLHVGICPPGATQCPPGAPRHEFLVHDRGNYRQWVPSPLDLPMSILGTDPLNPKRWLWLLLITGSISAVGLAAAWRFRDEIRSMI